MTQPVSSVTAVLPKDTVYTVNDSDVKVVDGRPSLLVDEIVSTDNSASGSDYRGVLVDKAVKLVGEGFQNVATQAKYLDLVDEPTNHLDIKFQFEVLNLVKDLNISTLCVLHNIELSARYCDYLYAMKQGRIVAEGAPNKLITKETIRTIYDVESEIYTNPITQDLAVAFLPTRYR